MAKKKLKMDEWVVSVQGEVSLYLEDIYVKDGRDDESTNVNINEFNRDHELMDIDDYELEISVVRKSFKAGQESYGQEEFDRKVILFEEFVNNNPTYDALMEMIEKAALVAEAWNKAEREKMLK